MLERAFMPVLRHLDRKHWRDDISRDTAYAELASRAAECSLAALNGGGYEADARTLAALSESLIGLGRMPPERMEAILEEVRRLTLPRRRVTSRTLGAEGRDGR